MMIKMHSGEAFRAADDDLLELPRSEAVTLVLLRLAAPVLDLESRLREIDFERVPSLRDFIAISRNVIDELGYGED
jgi:hypothetical protein